MSDWGVLIAFSAGWLVSLIYSIWSDIRRVRRVSEGIAKAMTPNEARLLGEILDSNGPELSIDYRRLALLDNLVLGVACLQEETLYKQAKELMHQPSMLGRVQFVKTIAKYAGK